MHRALDLGDEIPPDVHENGALVHSVRPVICWFHNEPHPEHPDRVIFTNAHVVEGRAYWWSYRYNVEAMKPDGTTMWLFGARPRDFASGPLPRKSRRALDV
jgi:hypothetical protein